MKKKSILLLLLILLLVGCTKTEEKKNDDNNINDKDNEIEKDEIDLRIDEMMKNMSTDKKIAQMMIVYYRNSYMDNTLKTTLEEVKPGGFILFKENITTYQNTLKLIKEIKASNSIPMFIAIDEEGGNVQRLLALTDKEVTNIPYMSTVGNKDDEDLTYNIGKLTAEELRVFGINMDFAPVIDVFSNPNNKVIGKRSFGSTPELVSKHGLAFSKGLEDNNVISSFKHFPGHGNTEVDSHKDLPIVSKTKEELMKSDLIPFIDAIENNANLIMIGHLAVPEITQDNVPASLSKKLITDFLKNELNYKGLVVTDALDMKALTNYYSDEEICGAAVEAGVDILLMPSSSRKCLKSVKDALKEGKITEEKIDESVRKILRLKIEKVEKNYNEYLDPSYLNSKEHQEIINKLK